MANDMKTKQINRGRGYKQPLDIPFQKDRSQKLVPWMMGLLVYLSLFALAGALSLNDMADRWSEGMENALSIELPAPLGQDRFAPGLQGDDMNHMDGQSDQLQAKAIAIARSFDGVIDVIPLSNEDMINLVEPWLGGDHISLQFLPLPKLINLVIDPKNPPNSRLLAQELNIQIPGAKLIEYDEWRLRLVSYINALRLLAAMILMIVVICVGGLIVFVSLSGLTAYKVAVELLHVMGAHDDYIAGQFQSQILKASIKGGGLGFLCAVLTILSFGHFVLDADLRFHALFVMNPIDWLWLILTPFIVAMIAALTARITVIRSLSKLYS